MQARALLEQLDALDVTVTAVGEKLQLRPGSRVPPELVEALRQQKAEVLAFLSRESERSIGQGILTLLAWASEMAEQDLVLSTTVTYIEARQNTVTTGRVSYYASHYLRTITSARIGQQTGGWGIFNAQWHKEREREALYALAALRKAVEARAARGT